MRKARLHIPGQTIFHHCVARLRADIRHFSKPEMEIVKSQLRENTEYCGLDFLVFSICSSRFDLLIALPAEAVDVSEEEFFRRLRWGQPPAIVTQLEKTLHDNGSDSPEWARVKGRYTAQMGDLSKFAQRINMKVSLAINKKRNRSGKLWRDRLITIPVEASSEALINAAAYIDSRPLADNLCQNPFRNPYCSLAIASAGDEHWRASYRRLFGQTWWRTITAAYRPAVEAAAEIPVTDRGPEAWGDLNQDALRGRQREQSVRGAGTTPEQRKKQFDERLKELAAFKERFGHCDVPATWEENPGLGTWAINQRAKAREGRLSEERRQALEQLGFRWLLRRKNPKKASPKRDASTDKLSDRWLENYEKLRAFCETYGHARVPSTHDKTLYRWILRQRQLWRRGECSEQEIAMLDAIGFIWVPSRAQKSPAREAGGEQTATTPREETRDEPAADSERKKRCKRCGATKPLSAFNRQKQNPDGRRKECRECQKQQQREYYQRLARSPCSVPGCNSPRRSKLYCSRHKTQFLKHGRILPRTQYDGNDVIIEGEHARLLLRNRSHEVVCEATIDAEDADKVTAYPWSYSHPNVVWCRRLQMSLNRFIMNPAEHERVIHLNNNVLDFRKSNLRKGVQQQSAIYRKLNKNNSSGVRGVSWNSTHRKWVVQIKRDHKTLGGGLYKDFNEAVAARKELEQRVWGDLLFDE